MSKNLEKRMGIAGFDAPYCYPKQAKNRARTWSTEDGIAPAGRSRSRQPKLRAVSSFLRSPPYRAFRLRVGTDAACPRTGGWRGVGGGRCPAVFLPVPPCPASLSLFFLLASLATRAVTDRQAARTQPHPPPRGSPRFLAPKPATIDQRTQVLLPSAAPHLCGPEIEPRRAVGFVRAPATATTGYTGWGGGGERRPAADRVSRGRQGKDEPRCPP